jgi:hypothetical protein
LHLHHAYIGLIIMALSALTISFRNLALTDHDYNFWIALGVFFLGLCLFLHDVIWHLTHRRRK